MLIPSKASRLASEPQAHVYVDTARVTSTAFTASMSVYLVAESLARSGLRLVVYKVGAGSCGPIIPKMEEAMKQPENRTLNVKMLINVTSSFQGHVASMVLSRI